MLVSETVILKWSRTNKNYYINKGYEFTKFGDSFEVKINDLTESSSAQIILICDYCGEQIKNSTYGSYIRHRKNLNKDSCKNCKGTKTKEFNIKKYGIDSPNKLEEYKDRIGIKNRKYSKQFLVYKLEEKNYFLFEDIEYKNVYERFLYICRKHKYLGPQETDLYNLMKSTHCCVECKRRKKKFKIKKINDRHISKIKAQKIKPEPVQNLTKKKYEKMMNDSGLRIVGEIVDSKTPIKYICEKHPDIVQKITPSKLRIGRRCRLCAIDKRSGKNHYNYKGGVSSLNVYLRQSLRPLILEKMKEYNFKCAITGENGKIEVHHLYSFNKIVYDTMKELNLPIYENIYDYSESEITKISTLFLSKHINDWGVPLLSEIHDKFHKQYGLLNNTKEQFYEFKNKYGK